MWRYPALQKSRGEGKEGLCFVVSAGRGEKDIVLTHKAVYVKTISIFSRLSHSWFEIGNACEKYQGGFYCKPFQIPP